jgi:hypothetical protein
MVHPIDPIFDQIVEHLHQQLNLKVSLFVHIANKTLPTFIQHSKEIVLQ